MTIYLKIKTWYENKLFLFRVKRGLTKIVKKKYYRYSLKYKWISIFKNIWFAHWQFIITTVLTVISIVIAIFAFILTK